MKEAKQLCHGYRLFPFIISHAVWLYHRFCLSFRDVKTFWPNVELGSRMNPFGNGATDSVRNMRESLRNDKVDWVTPGISTRCSLSQR